MQQADRLPSPQQILISWVVEDLAGGRTQHLSDGKRHFVMPLFGVFVSPLCVLEYIVRSRSKLYSLDSWLASNGSGLAGEHVVSATLSVAEMPYHATSARQLCMSNVDRRLKSSLEMVRPVHGTSVPILPSSHAGWNGSLTEP